MIIVEGQIGVGKTTMGEILETRLEKPLFRELNNPQTLSLLDRFYADKPRWAFTLQVHFLNERFRMIKEIFRNGGGILDRSIFGDRIFAQVLHEDGDMSDEEYDTYVTLLENMLEHVQEPSLLVYLDCSVDTAMARIRKRNRGLESTIPRQYLRRLNEHYLAWYSSYNRSPKVWIDTERYPLEIPENAERVVQEVRDAL